jgi:sugar phosphate isomerase/epimerase
MMIAPIALQLYTLRAALAADYVGTIEAVAKIGYLGVETAGAFGDSVESASKLFKDLGMQVCAMHSKLPLGDNKNSVLDTAAALGTDKIILAWMPPENYRTLDGIKSVADRLNEANIVAREHGLQVAYHNHEFEFIPLADGSLPHAHLVQLTAPTVLFELDTYWIKTAGIDPVTIIQQLGSRAPLLHLKDGPAARGVPQTAIGEGVLDLPAIVKTGEHTAKWHVVELDECATDMLEAVTKSYHYLTSKGLSRGKSA